jgi:hypothetical protein
MLIRFLAASLTLLLSSSPVMATTVISELGSAPLIGQSKSTAELQLKVSRNEGRLAGAAARLGMTPQEYRTFRTQLQSPAWVTVPRHLDAMAWYGDGGIHVIRDVRIPANTNGWEVDVQEGNQTLQVFLPATCGNLSILRRFAPHVAQAQATRPPWGVLPSRQAAAVPPVAAAPPVEQAPAVATVPPPLVAAPTGGLGGLLPLLLLLLPGGGHGGTSLGPPPLGAPVPTAPPVPGPTPPPAPCVCPS